MRILFVDDEPSRVEHLLRLLAEVGSEAEVTHRAHPRVVSDADLDTAAVVFLDHDMCAAGLDPDVPCPSTGDPFRCECPDGRDLVRRILARPCPPGQRYVVHSMNWEGHGEVMAKMLADAGRNAVREKYGRWHLFAPTGLLRRFGILRAERVE